MQSPQSLERRSRLYVRIVLGSLVLASLTSSCYVFRKKGFEQGKSEGASSGVLGSSLGDRAGTLNETALAQVYGVTTVNAPAGIRPDPDTFVRRLLLQYREEGSAVAQEIGRVEQYRMLLGGASNNFAIVPQESYDATSLLAKMKVAEEVCQGLVDPDSGTQSEWDSILPASPSDSASNIKFLAQRLTGKPSNELSAEALTQLTAILATAKVNGAITAASYIPVCATLIIDAEALLL